MWDDEVAALAAWRDARHLPDNVAGYGLQPGQPHVDRWHHHVKRSLHIRTWLHDHTPHLTPEPSVALTPTEVVERIAELDTLLATAPPDQTKILDDLHAGHLTPPDIDAAIAAALDTQHGRRSWILEHWPHIVEHTQLTQLRDRHGALAHWPTPLTADEQRRYDDLDAISTDTDEERSLTDLDAALAAVDPHRHLNDVEAQLDELDAQIRAIRTERSATHDPARIDMLDSTLQTLFQRHKPLRDEATSARAQLHLHRWGAGRPQHDLIDAVTRRRTHLAHHAITNRAEWVTAILRATGQQGHTPEALYRLIIEAAAYRERHDVHGPDPLGHPAPDDLQALIDQLHTPQPRARTTARTSQTPDLTP